MFGPDTKKVRGKQTVTLKKIKIKKRFEHKKKGITSFCKVHARFLAKNESFNQ